MSVDRHEGEEGFLRRWARVKGESQAQAERTGAAPAPLPGAPGAPEQAPPALPPIEKLTLESDFSGFFHPKVDESLRRQALRKLFSDPHFNVMDGLDVYIDDYSKSEPIPAAMLAGLRQAQKILEWAAEKPANDDAAREAGAPPSSSATLLPEGQGGEAEPALRPYTGTALPSGEGQG